MPSPQPTHHGYAVNVKDHGHYSAERGPLTDDEVQAIYDNCAEGFWHDAELIAQDHGFRTVYSSGRMGGWCEPSPQPPTDDMWPSELEEWIADRFRPFEADVLECLPYWHATFVEDLAEAVARAEREPAERAHWEARDTITVDR